MQFNAIARSLLGKCGVELKARYALFNHNLHMDKKK